MTSHMTEPHPLAVLVVRYRRIVRWACVAAGIYAVLTGVATMLGGDMRFEGVSYSAHRMVSQSLGWSPAVLWGGTVLLVGLLALAPHRKATLCGLYGIAAWSLLLSLGFLRSLNIEPLAGVSGVFAHAFIATMLMALIVTRMVDRQV